MSRSIVETLMGAAIICVAGYFFVTAYRTSGNDGGAGSYSVYAKFNDITGISIGSDVRISGIKIGSVSALTLDKERFLANVTMNIRDDVKLPTDTDAAIIGESLLGGKFLAVTPGGSSDTLNAGDEIEFTQSSISLEQLLGKFVFSGGGVDGGSDASSVGTDNDDDIELSLP